MRTRHTLAAVVGTLVAATLIVLASRSCSPAPTPTGARASRVDGAELEIGSPPTGRAPGHAGRDGAWFGVRICGRVVSAVTALPLAARVASDGVFTVSDPATGEFEIVAPAAPAEIEIRARGYISHRFSPSGPLHETGTIRLVPERSTHVRVTEVDGRSVAGAAIDFVSTAPGVCKNLHSRRGFGNRTVLARTDVRGRAEIRVGQPGYLLARSRERVSAPAFLGRGVREIRLVLPARPSARLRVVDEETRRPLAGIALRLERFDEPLLLPLRLRSGEDGLTDRISPGRYRLFHEEEFVELLPGPTGAYGSVSAHHRAGLRTVSVPPDAEIVEVPARLRAARGRLRLLDARTRAPLAEATVLVEGQMALAGGWYWEQVGRLRAPRPLTDGWAEVALPSEKSTVLYRLLVWAPGYAPAFLPDPRGGLPVRELALEPVSRRRGLRLLTPSGRPFGGPVRLRELPLGLPLFRGRADAAGRLGPFPWNGGDVEVRTLDERTLGTARASELEASDSVIVRVPTGARLVVECPEGVDPAGIDCVDAKRNRHSGSVRDGALVYDDLPAGPYRIGPPALLRISRMIRNRSDGPLRVELEDGEERTIRARESWIPVESVRGRVDAEGIAASRLFVAPLYGPESVRVQPGHFYDYDRVAADGSYELRDLPLRPTRILVGTLPESGVDRVLAVEPVGAVLRVSCGDVRVDVEGLDDPDARVGARYRLEPEGGVLVDPEVIAYGAARDGLLLRWVPTSVRTLEVAVTGRERRTVRLRLRPGSRQSVTVDFSSPGQRAGK